MAVATCQCGRGCFAIGRAGEHSCKPLILFQTTPAGIVAEPQEVAVFIGHLSLDADLVAVEVAGLLAVFAVFVDVVLTGETACVRIAHILRQD